MPEPARALRRQRGARRHRPPQNGAGIRHLVACAIAGFLAAARVDRRRPFLFSSTADAAAGRKQQIVARRHRRLGRPQRSERVNVARGLPAAQPVAPEAVALAQRARPVQLSDQGVTGLGDEESTAIGWLTAAVQKCARALDLARCLEGTLIGDGRALTI